MTTHSIFEQVKQEEIYEIVERKFQLLTNPEFEQVDRLRFERILDKFFWGEEVSIQDFKSVAPSLVLNYLRLSHFYYLNIQLPKIAMQIDSIYTNTNRLPQVYMVKKIFENYCAELGRHIEHEEGELFQIIDKLINEPERFCRISQESFLVKFYAEHEDTEDVLYELMKLIETFPELDKSRLAVLKNSIDFLAKDLSLHHVLEEQVLIPLVLASK